MKIGVCLYREYSPWSDIEIEFLSDCSNVCNCSAQDSVGIDVWALKISTRSLSAFV